MYYNYWRNHCCLWHFRCIVRTYVYIFCLAYLKKKQYCGLYRKWWEHIWQAPCSWWWWEINSGFDEQEHICRCLLSILFTSHLGFASHAIEYNTTFFGQDFFLWWFNIQSLFLLHLSRAWWYLMFVTVDSTFLWHSDISLEGAAPLSSCKSGNVVCEAAPSEDVTLWSARVEVERQQLHICC